MTFKLSWQSVLNAYSFVIVVYGKSKRNVCVCVFDGSTFKFLLCRTDEKQSFLPMVPGISISPDQELSVFSQETVAGRETPSKAQNWALV